MISNYSESEILLFVEKYKKITKEEYLDELEYYKKKIDKYQQEHKLKCLVCGKILSSITNYKYHINSKKCMRKKGFECLFCKKFFTRSHNYNYHILNNVCGLIEQTDNIHLNIDDNKNKLSNSITNNTDNSTHTNNNTNNSTNTNNTDNSTTNNIQTQNNNNQQNIIIAVSGKENIEEVCKQVCKLIPFRYTKYKPSVRDLIGYFNNPNKAIQQIIINEHFNPDKPEQMNIHNTNCRSNRMQVFDEDENGIERWITRDKTDVCDDLYEKSVNEMFFAKTNLKVKGYHVDSKKEKTMNDKIKELETNKKVRKEYMDKIADVTWDYRDVVQQNKKLIA